MGCEATFTPASSSGTSGALGSPFSLSLSHCLPLFGCESGMRGRRWQWLLLPQQQRPSQEQQRRPRDPLSFISLHYSFLAIPFQISVTTKSERNAHKDERGYAGTMDRARFKLRESRCCCCERPSVCVWWWMSEDVRSRVETDSGRKNERSPADRKRGTDLR